MREIAYRVPIKILWLGDYMKSDEQYKPNYVKFKDLMINRAHVVGVVVDRYDNESSQYSSITIDDGTKQIRVKFFGEDTRFLKNIEIGSTVRVIGKVKENDGERYLVGEIARKLDDPNWQVLWRLEVIDKFRNDLVEEDENKTGRDKDINEKGEKGKESKLDIEEYEV